MREDERDWEGAAERLLHNFGLSLLVPDGHYPAVADWVERTHLRGRLVYYRVREPRATQSPDLHPDSLVRKLAIRPDSAFYPWLEAELARRFDYACCADLDRFRREPKAPSPGPGRSRPAASATRRTTATASTTAPATSSAGPTRPRSPPWRSRPATCSDAWPRPPMPSPPCRSAPASYSSVPRPWASWRCSVTSGSWTGAR
ncbi:MAG: hypothetical protein U5L11_10580 [Arhodomonas sp.]|nr:hypothetical protein [Arhodomonas sp.]